MKKTLTKSVLLVSLLLNAILLYIIIEKDISVTNTDNNTKTEQQKETQTKQEPVVYESGKSYPLMRIVDGDTIVIGFEDSTKYVRLIGIDSPEPNDPGGPQCYSNEATAHLQEIAKTGIVILYFDETQGMYDGYGRLLAYVELPDKTDLAKQMLYDGYAREFTYNKDYSRQSEYRKAENDARINERGLWKKGVCD